MGKRLKAIFTVILAFFVFLSAPALDVQAANMQTMTKANELAAYCYEGYNGGVEGPIIVTKGTLVTGSSSKEVYLITLSGTELVTKQATGYFTDLLAGFNQNNAYLDNVIRVISQNIPKGSNLVLSGHSLGGMIAQQVAASSYIKDNYNVLNTVTFGSPLIAAGEREGTVKRLGDWNDAVPYLSATGSIETEVWKVFGLQRESGGYGFASVEAHVDSYLREDLWGKYDITGTKNGGAKLILDMDTKTFYHAPNIV